MAGHEFIGRVSYSGTNTKESERNRELDQLKQNL